jgi:hypothetical protein
MHRGMFSLLAARDTTTRYEIPSAAVSRSSLRIRFDNLTSIPSGRPPLYHRPEFRTIPWRVEVCPLARAHFELAYDHFVPVTKQSVCGSGTAAATSLARVSDCSTRRSILRVSGASLPLQTSCPAAL